MSDYTSKLNLYKVDPAIDGEDTFNIKSMMNDNWDKIDEKVGNMDEKLSGVEDNANNYNHPDTHDADMIKIKDEGGKFTGDNVEDALGEVGSQLTDIANVIVASGTGTAITLNMPSVTAYKTNMKLTFIAKANNNGNTTTININGKGAKRLYKPNITVAPNIKSGKPYTVWYNGTHFFLQASAEGNALAEHVLAGKTFSNDDATEIIGTMNLNNLIASNIRQGININGIVGSLREGLKMATGKIHNLGMANGDSHYVKISNLVFRPKIVITTSKITAAEGSTSYKPRIGFAVYSEYQYFYNHGYTTEGKIHYSSSHGAFAGVSVGGNSSMYESNWITINDNGFESTDIAPYANRGSTTATIEWVAIG
ncbi:hypothetical protein [Vallitalea maricola]|uniref:Uncharacterized protein n=1 Tax=Vallitalea maricola TaxID=3074433 RepID=A0ACB5UKB7_9FIRM|nr:hypothetical protein AN2V17_15850 [Vallitalea sp. AN17-2]